MKRIALISCVAVSVVAVATCAVVCLNVLSEPKILAATIPLSDNTPVETPEENTNNETEEETSDFELVRSSVSKIGLMSADEYIENIYPFNVNHPKVLDLGKDGWNDYRYWVSYTPYPSGFDYYENPHVVATNDFINYSNILHCEQPLENYSESVRFNSDSCIVFNEDLNRMELFWRYTDYSSDYVALKMRSSEDGRNWSETETFFETYDIYSCNMESPSIIYESGTYKVWYVSDNEVYYRECTEGEWSDPTFAELNHEDKSETAYIDVIKTDKGYEVLSTSSDNKALYYATSQDGIKWSKAKSVLTPSGDVYKWDGCRLYKASFIHSDGLYYVLYSGENDYIDIGVGFLFGKDMNNLYGTDLDYLDDGINSSTQFWKFIEKYKRFTTGKP